MIESLDFVLQAMREDVGTATLTQQQLSISARAPFKWGLAELADVDEFTKFLEPIPGYTVLEEDGRSVPAIVLKTPQEGVAMIGFAVDVRYEAGPEARFFLLDSTDPETAEPMEITGDLVINFGGKPVVPLFPIAAPCPYGVTHMVPEEQLPARAGDLARLEQSVEESVGALSDDVASLRSAVAGKQSKIQTTQGSGITLTTGSPAFILNDWYPYWTLAASPTERANLWQNNQGTVTAKKEMLIAVRCGGLQSMYLYVPKGASRAVGPCGDSTRVSATNVESKTVRIASYMVSDLSDDTIKLTGTVLDIGPTGVTWLTTTGNTLHFDNNMAAWNNQSHDSAIVFYKQHE